MPLSHVLLAIAPATALLVAGCGTQTLDTGELQHKLAEQIAPQGGVDPSDVSVACPDDQEAKEGRTFDCELTAPNGDKVTVKVTLTNDEGGFTATVPE